MNEKIHWLFLIIIICVTGIIYYPSLFGEFVIDDKSYFKNSLLIQLELSDIDAFFFDITNPWGETLPLRDYFFAIQYHFFGDWTMGYHLMSFSLFFVSGFVLFHFGKRIFEDMDLNDRISKDKYWSASLASCIIVGFLFLNPMYVESVAYISGQKDILSFLMILSSLYFLHRAGKNSTKTMYWLFLLGVFLHYLGVLSKLTAIATIIFVPLLWIVTSNKKSVAIVKMIAFWLVANIPVFLWFHHLLTRPTSASELLTVSLVHRIIRAVNFIGIYLTNISWPNKLSFGYLFEYNYEAWDKNLNVYFFIGIIFILGLVVSFIKNRKSMITLGMLLFIIYLLPVLSIFPDMDNEKIYDRYLTLPLTGVFIIIMSLLNKTYQTWPKTKMILASFIVFIFIFWSAFTINYVPVFKNDLAVFKNRYKLNPTVALNFERYVKHLILAKNYNEAEFLLRNTDERLVISDASVEYLLGFNYFLQSKKDKAEPLLYSSSIKATKRGEYPYANYYLALIYLEKGNNKIAENLLREQLAHPQRPVYDVVKAEKLLKKIEQVKQN